MRLLALLAIGILFLIGNGCATVNQTEDAPLVVPEPQESVVANAGASAANLVVPIIPPTLSGHWKSEAPEPSGNGRYAVRELNFDGNRWELNYTLASDKKMSRVIFHHKASGTFNLQKPSQRIDGAYLIVFRNLKKTLQIQRVDKITEKEMGFDVCGVPMGQETDVTGKGCGVVMRVGECPEDFDLVRQESRQGSQYLLLGNRFDEFSSCSEDKRPVALGPSLVRKDP